VRGRLWRVTNMAFARYPSLCQINTRVWLTELSQSLGRSATLEDIPDAELDRLAAMGFDWVWFLSVWQTGSAGQLISRSNSDWRREFEETLPDLHEEDIAGSGFANEDGYGLGREEPILQVAQRLAMPPGHEQTLRVWCQFERQFLQSVELLIHV